MEKASKLPEANESPTTFSNNTMKQIRRISQPQQQENNKMMTVQRQASLTSRLALLFLCTLLASRESHGFSASPLRRPLFSTAGTTNGEAIPVTTATGVSERVFEIDERPIMLFDGVCNLCDGAVNQIIDWDPDGKFRFAALQSRVGQSLLQSHGMDADDITSIVVVTDHGVFVKSDAVLRIAQELNPPWIGPVRLGLSLLPSMIRDKLFDMVYSNRYEIMGKKDECRLDFDGEFDDRFVNDEDVLVE